jgi:acyl-CoA hydrolase
MPSFASCPDAHAVTLRPHGIRDRIVNDAVVLELPLRGSAAEDEVIGRTIASLVPDGACLQMGVGALPNLVCAELKDRNDLGITPKH